MQTRNGNMQTGKPKFGFRQTTYFYLGIMQTALLLMLPININILEITKWPLTKQINI